MSFSLTTGQVRRGEKTVTRRFGWATLEPGTVLWAVEKAMGLKKGERVRRIRPIRVVSVRAEPLSEMVRRPAYGDREAVAEGFPEMTGAEFARFFCREMRCAMEAAPNRIEFVYIQPEDPDWPRA